MISSTFVPAKVLLSRVSKTGTGWQIGDDKQLSHYCWYGTSGQVHCDNSYASLRAAHEVREPLATAPANVTSQADERVFAARAGIRRGKAVKEHMIRVWDRLEALGLKTSDSKRFNLRPLEFKSGLSESDIVRPFKMSIPSALNDAVPLPEGR